MCLRDLARINRWFGGHRVLVQILRSLLQPQERFTIHQDGADPLLWQIPVVVGPAGDPLHPRVLLLKGNSPEKVNFDPDVAIKANLGDQGYYRSQYSAPLFKRRACPALPKPNFR